LYIYAVKDDSIDAGPSLKDNKRLEVFLAGCKKAMSGHPCPDCFNSLLWESREDTYQSVEEVYNGIVSRAKQNDDNKYITFVGGEPMDQADELKELCQLLHNDGFHIIIITHLLFKTINKRYTNMADMWIDGSYKPEFRIFDSSKKDNVHNVIGSGNQCVYTKIVEKNGVSWQGVSANIIKKMTMLEGNKIQMDIDIKKPKQ
jgi:organic radical activating enzyme